MNSCLNGYTHGPVHIMLGGQMAQTPPVLLQHNLWKIQLLLAKNLWRQGYMSCPKYCSQDTDSTGCKCTVASDLYSESDDGNKFR